MKNYLLNDSLASIYDDVRTELGFDLSLSSLMADKDIWGTDIVNGINQVYRHLFRANSYETSAAEKTNQLLLAELCVRELLENLTNELAEPPTQIVTTEKRPLAPSNRTSRPHGALETTNTSLAVDNDSSKVHHHRFGRSVPVIEVVVDHFSDTNFFSDISYDVRSVGLFVATYNILKIGTPLNVRVVLPGRKSFQMNGTVSWVRESDNCTGDISPGMGIAFTELSHEICSEIQRFMSERPPLLFEVA